MSNVKKRGIMKFINYKVADETNFQKGIDYILRQDSTMSDFKGSQYLTLDKPVDGMRIINNRWHPRGTRLFKHGVFSFGVSDLSPKLAFDVTKEILDYYADYPRDFKQHYNKIAFANKLPPLKGFENNLDCDCVETAVIPSINKGIAFEDEPGIEYCIGNEMGYVQSMLPPTIGVNPIVGVNRLINDFQKNMYQWYLLGRSGRR